MGGRLAFRNTSPALSVILCSWRFT